MLTISLGSGAQRSQVTSYDSLRLICWNGITSSTFRGQVTWSVTWPF